MRTALLITGVAGLALCVAMLAGCGGSAEVSVIASDAGSVAPCAINGRIAFVSNRNTGQPQIWSMKTDGTGRRDLSQSPGTPDSSPSWSPDGSKLVFSRTQGGVRRLYTMKADGSNQTGITPGGYSGYSPAWSPDGSRIAFVSNYSGGGAEICTCKPDGSDWKRLTNNPAEDTNPAWSPDSQRLLFASNRLGNMDLYVMKLDRSGLTRLTHHSGDDIEPTWSGVTGKIVFSCDNDLFIMDPDGSHRRHLTNSPYASERYPCWAPSGSRIAYACATNKYPSAGYDVYTMKADGTDRRRLTLGDALDWMPNWAVGTL